MLLQLLILGKRDNQTHERLPITGNALSFDSAPIMARNHENVARGLTKLQIASVNRSCKAPIKDARPAYPNTGRHHFCIRCGEKHFTLYIVTERS